MEQLYITNLTIKKVRHLKDISIPLAENQIKHLIFTGKNGSGKTSVTEAIAGHLQIFTLKTEMPGWTCIKGRMLQRLKAKPERQRF